MTFVQILNKMSEFYTKFAREMNKMPEFYMIFGRLYPASMIQLITK